MPIIPSPRPVTNQGAGAATPSTTRFYLSTNALLDAGDIALAPGRTVPGVNAGAASSGTTSVTVPPGTAPGAYILLAKADAANAVGEGIETNNVAARGIQVTIAPQSCHHRGMYLWWVVAALLVIVGLAGIVLPAVPGTLLIFAGLWLAAWADNFMRVGAWTLVLLGVMAAASYTVDLVMMALGMTRLGATRRAMAGAAIGLMVGVFFGLPGLVFGPFAGAVAGELTEHSDLGRAGRAGVAAWIGVLIGTVVKVGLAFAMVGIFLAAWLVF